MKTSNNGKSVALPLAIVFTVSVISAAQAQSTWVAKATGDPTLWSKNLNWDPNGVPGVPNSKSAIAVFALPSKPNPFVDVPVNLSQIQFLTNSPAYTITVNAGKGLSLHGAGITNQSAFTQTFVNNGILLINSTGTAGINVSITNNLTLRFTDSSKAGSAIITTNPGGSTLFLGASSGDQAQFITNAGGLVEISALTTAGTTAGSIAGAGTYNLGSKEFTVGSNNLSTTVSGLIEGTGGSLVKVGTGTLELDGASTYTGGTIISGGTLQLGNGGATGTAEQLHNRGTIYRQFGDDDYDAGGRATAQNLIVGESGVGILAVQNGGILTDSGGFVGDLPGSSGTATVSGAGSTWTNSGTIQVGAAGTGTLTIENGGTVNSGGGGSIGLSAGSLVR